METGGHSTQTEVAATRHRGRYPADFDVERLVTAREVARTFQLPLYFFTRRDTRARLQIPHFRIGTNVRFKLSEIDAWQQQRSEAIAFFVCPFPGDAQ